MKKIVLSWLVCVLALVALLAWVGRDILPAGDGQPSDTIPIVKGAFSLQSPTGATVTEQDFKGRYMLVFFGFTHCPDICPTTLLLLQNVVAKLGEDGKKLQPIFITVDPERDTPALVGDYVSHFGNGVVGLSGTPAQVKAAADNFKVYFSKVEMSDPSMGYMINHSGFIYLLGPDGQYLSHFAHDVSESDLEAGLRKFVR